jgi:hypothetical protein
LDLWNHNDHCGNGGHAIDPLDLEPPHEFHEEDFPLYKRRELKLALQTPLEDLRFQREGSPGALNVVFASK